MQKKDFQFPECWKNDVRMSALFAPFRSKTVNPSDWISKMEFWTSLIEKWCKFNKSPSFNISTLKNNFSRKDVYPACLEDVIQHLSSTGVLLFKETCFTNDNSWKNWAFQVLVKTPLKWTFNTIKNTLVGEDEPKEILYIHLPVINHLSKNFLKQVSSHQGKLVDLNELMTLSEFENSEDLLLVIQWLEKQNLAAFCYESSSILVKLSKNEMKPVQISEIDLGIYKLGNQERVLEKCIEKLESEKNEALEEAKRHLALKRKNMAKHSLRKKKEIEKSIEKRITALENIQALITKINQIKIDSEIINCYKTGIEALKQTFKETGLNENAVLSTMEELEDELNKTNKIDEALTKPLDKSLDQCLEDELNELLLMDAPSVPQGEVSPTNEKKKDKKYDELHTKMEALSM